MSTSPYRAGRNRMSISPAVKTSKNAGRNKKVRNSILIKNFGSIQHPTPRIGRPYQPLSYGHTLNYESGSNSINSDINADMQNGRDAGADLLKMRKSSNFCFAEQSNQQSILQIRETDSTGKFVDSTLSLIKEQPPPIKGGVPRYNEPMF